MPAVAGASKDGFVVEVEKLASRGSLCRANVPFAVMLRSISRRPAAAAGVGVFVLSSLDWRKRGEGVSV